jgi:hypothetical protein
MNVRNFKIKCLNKKLFKFSINNNYLMRKKTLMSRNILKNSISIIMNVKNKIESMVNS